MEQSGNTDLFDLHIDQSSMNYLSEAARWARFLSIIGFIYCGLMIICGIFIGSIMSMMVPSMGGESAAMSAVGTGFVGVFIVIVSLLLFFPAYYLFSFSSKIKRALHNNDQPVLTDALKNLKSFFKFYGILLIILISFYVLAIVVAVIGAMVARH